MLSPARRSTTIALAMSTAGAIIGFLGVGVVELVQQIREHEAQPLTALIESRERSNGLRPVAYKVKLPTIRSLNKDELAYALESPVEEGDIEAEELPASMAPDGTRTNPFEFGIDVAFEKVKVGAESIENIKLYGFVGSDSPRAIINAGGQTKILSAGERWGVIEMLEVTPPNVRIRLDGVTRTWSILGKADAEN